MHKTRFRPVKLWTLPERTLNTNDDPLVLFIVKTYIAPCRVFADGLARIFASANDLLLKTRYNIGVRIDGRLFSLRL